MKRYVLALLAILLFSTGCSSKKIEEKAEDIVTQIDIQLDGQLSEELKKDSLSWLPQTIEELYAMSIDDFRTMITANISDIKAYFVVPEGYEITDADWPNFRDIFSRNIFGKMLNVNSETTEDESSLENNAGVVSEENSIQYGDRDENGNIYLPDYEDSSYSIKFVEWYPTAEEIAAYSREEFVEFLKVLEAWATPLRPEGYIPPDFDNLSDDELEELREWQIEVS